MSNRPCKKSVNKYYQYKVTDITNASIIITIGNTYNEMSISII